MNTVLQCAIDFLTARAGHRALKSLLLSDHNKSSFFVARAGWEHPATVQRPSNILYLTSHWSESIAARETRQGCPTGRGLLLAHQSNRALSSPLLPAALKCPPRHTTPTCSARFTFVPHQVTADDTRLCASVSSAEAIHPQRAVLRPCGGLFGLCASSVFT